MGHFVSVATGLATIWGERKLALILGGGRRKCVQKEAELFEVIFGDQLPHTLINPW